MNGTNTRSDFEPSGFLTPLDIATIVYVIVSGIYICFGISRLEDTFEHFGMRILILGFIFFMAYINKKFPNDSVTVVRNFYPLLFINYFYPETSYLKNIIFDQNLDDFICQKEVSLFGCHPSLEFSKLMPQGWFNEFMSFSYFSFYAFNVLVCIAMYIKNRQEFYRATSIIIFSFYMYYIVFSFIPVIGPQYYFTGDEATIPHPYFFGKLMHFLHDIAEKPTGAFPSSHVGIMLILVYVTYKNMPKLFYVTIAFTICIIFATIYLKAHYILDIIAGAISAPIFIMISNFVYNRLHPFKVQEPLRASSDFS